MVLRQPLTKVVIRSDDDTHGLARSRPAPPARIPVTPAPFLGLVPPGANQFALRQGWSHVLSTEGLTGLTKVYPLPCVVPITVGREVKPSASNAGQHPRPRCENYAAPPADVPLRRRGGWGL
eukprot:gene12056-biopygen3624